MAHFGRISSSLENILGLKNCLISNKINLASFAKKVDVPAPPKRPLTAYMIFCKENRKDVLKENPSLTSPEQIKKLAEKWKQLSVDMKKPYEVTARQETQLYGEMHKEFYENLTEDQKEAIAKQKLEKKESKRLLKLKKSLRESGVPKAPATAYSLFVKSHAKGQSDFKHATAFIKEVAEKWNNLSEEAKKTLEEQAQKDKLRYIAEIDDWKKKLTKSGHTDLLQDFSELKGKRKFVTPVDISSAITATSKSEKKPARSSKN